jgi:hypothetical protein
MRKALLLENALNLSPSSEYKFESVPVIIVIILHHRKFRNLAPNFSDLPFAVDSKSVLNLHTSDSYCVYHS